jgi:hypothetical protein
MIAIGIDIWQWGRMKVVFMRSAPLKVEITMANLFNALLPKVAVNWFADYEIKKPCKSGAGTLSGHMQSCGFRKRPCL